jgi:hypothetical protein
MAKVQVGIRRHGMRRINFIFHSLDKKWHGQPNVTLNLDGLHHDAARP